MKRLLNILLLFTFVQLSAQNTNPVVSNVRFNEINSDGTVDIFYDVYDAEQNSVSITMYASRDSGQTYTWLYFYPEACLKVSGDIGDNVSIGSNKHIIWNFVSEHPNTYFSNFTLKLKIIADDKNVGGSPCPGIDSIEYGGKTYHTVLIDERCWLKENINLGTMINGTNEQQNNGVVEKYCYDNNEANCTKYGGLYEWAEAVQYKNGATNNTSPNPMFNEPVQGICPTGWHIPSKEEFLALTLLPISLVQAFDTTQIPGATNSSGFSGKTSGIRHSTKVFLHKGVAGYIWSSTPYADGVEIYANMLVLYVAPYALRPTLGVSTDFRIDGINVRCLMD